MKYYGLDLLRGIAAFGIVGCHLGLAQRTTGGEWVTALCNFNVGLFAAISGFLMNAGGGYIRKRAMRILPTYFVWSFFYVVATAVFDLVLDGGRLNERFYSVLNWAQILFCGGGGTHLWFLICLFYAQIILYSINFVLDSVKFQGVARNMLLGIVSVVLLVCSVAFSNWCCLYPIRLMAFMLLGYVLKDFVRTDAFCLPFGSVMFMLIVHLGMHNFFAGVHTGLSTCDTCSAVVCLESFS